MENTTFILIGAAILDVLARPVGADVFQTGSVPADTLTVHTGGDAMNEGVRPGSSRGAGAPCHAPGQ